MPRCAHFRVTGENFNGQREATVTIEERARATLFEVRPLYSKETFTLTLADVAKRIIRGSPRCPLQPGHTASRRAHFRVEGEAEAFDGRSAAKVTVTEQDTGATLIEVRPLRSGRIFSLTLADAAVRVVEANLTRERLSDYARRGRAEH